MILFLLTNDNRSKFLALQILRTVRMKMIKSKTDKATYASPIPAKATISSYANVVWNSLTTSSATTFERVHRTGMSTTYIDFENVSLQPSPGTTSISPENCPKVPA